MFPINQVVQGDCTRILQSLPDKCVDLIVTDPPYGVRYRHRLGRSVANDDDPSGILGAFTELYRVLKPDSLCICFYGWGLVEAFFRAWRQAGFRPVGHIVWVKDSPRENASCATATSRRSCLRRGSLRSAGTAAGRCSAVGVLGQHRSSDAEGCAHSDAVRRSVHAAGTAGA